MELDIPEGIEFSAEKTVDEKDTAKAYGSGLVEVFATPAMVAFMEYTAHKSIEPYLPAGFSSVGIEIHTSHIKASPLGFKITCHTKLAKADGKKLFFKISAYDQDGLIGEGIHVRYVIDMEKFMARLPQAKS